MVEIEDMDNTIIATNSSFERNILINELNKINNTGYQVKPIDIINKEVFDRSNSTLILPGPLRIKSFSELLKPYSKVIFLAYDGKNKAIIQEQINLISNYSFEHEKKLIMYLDEIYEVIGVKKNNLIEDYYKKQNNEIINEIKSENLIESNIELISNIINIAC